MTGTDLVPAHDAGELDSDPVQYMSVVLHRAKGWLAEAQSIDSVRATKAIAVGYESVIKEKELAFDAQLSATEIVRRCERRIGELVRGAQAEGRATGPGDAAAIRDRGISVDEYTQITGKLSPALVYLNTYERADSYAMADATNEAFEHAVGAAREEGNLSRANVVRKVKGDIPRTNGAVANGGFARPAAVSRIAEQAEAMAMAIGALDLTKSCERMTEDERQSALASCKAGLRALNTMAKALGR